MNELTVTRPQGLAYADLERLATSIAASGLFGIKTKDQAIALMMIAHAEGRHPALAARDYDIIQGRPSKKAEAMLRDFLEGGGKVQWHALSDEIADATFSHPAGGTARIAWDTARANKAGIGGKDNWKKFPRQMLRSRTVSEGVRTVWPLATSGMYVPEEAADIPAAGPTIEAHVEPNPPAVTYPLPKPARPGGMVETARTMQAEPEAPKGPTLRQVVARLIVEFGQAQSVGGLADIEARDEMQKILAREEGSDARKAVVKARDAARARLGVDTDSDWDTTERADPIAELIAEVEAMDADALDGLASNAAWRAKTRDLFPLDADRLEDAIAARKEALKQ